MWLKGTILCPFEVLPKVILLQARIQYVELGRVVGVTYGGI
jgi:hypothetical protein